MFDKNECNIDDLKPFQCFSLRMHLLNIRICYPCMAYFGSLIDPLKKKLYYLERYIMYNTTGLSLSMKLNKMSTSGDLILSTQEFLDMYLRMPSFAENENLRK